MLWRSGCDGQGRVLRLRPGGNPRRCVLDVILIIHEDRIAASLPGGAEDGSVFAPFGGRRDVGRAGSWKLWQD
jgi:hypothetical protein